MAEGDVVMSEELSMSAKMIIASLQGELERKRRIFVLREEVTKYTTLLAEAKASLAVEEAEAKDSGKLTRDMLETWQREVELRAEKAFDPKAAA